MSSSFFSWVVDANGLFFLAFQFPRALERLEELKKGGKNKAMAGKLTRDKKKDEENCAVM